jgi:hypothetical protein
VVYPSRKHLPLAVSAFIDLVLGKLDQMDMLLELPSSGKAQGLFVSTENATP